MLGNPWLKSYPKDVNYFANIEAKPIFHLLDEAVKNFPENQAIDFENEIIKYGTLGKMVEKASKAFTKIGVKRGTKVAIFLPNCPQFIITYFAVLKAGGCVVNCSPLYSESEVEFLAKDSETEIIVTLNLNLLFPKAKKILENSLAENGMVKKIIVASLPEFLPFPKNILFPIVKRKEISKVHYNENIISWANFIKLGQDNLPFSNPHIDLNETAVIQYTGGTTGIPKGAELSHANVYINAIQCKLYCPIFKDGQETMLVVLPLFHVFAMTAGMLFGIAFASRLILHPRFEAHKVLHDIQVKKPTAMPGVPTMFNALNNFPHVEQYNLRSLELCISGGGPLPVEIKKLFEEKTGCVVVEGYGLTETSPVATCNPTTALNKAGSIGLPLPQTEILIEDMDSPGKFLGIGERGEVCIKGPQVMKGYHHRTEATEQILRDGILRTGDVGMVDEDGYIFIVDRLKEMIISGGFKIYPRHVEEVLYKHEHILECAVVAMPDEYSGQRVKAYFVLKKDAQCSKEEVMAYCRQKLAKHEVPKEIVIKESLPKSPVGKILKRELS